MIAVRRPGDNFGPDDAQEGLTLAVRQEYAKEVYSIARVPAGMGSINWRVLTNEGEFFLKQFTAEADLASEIAAIELSQFARSKGIPSPCVLSTRVGDRVASVGSLRFAMFDYVPDATSGVALSPRQMVEAGSTLGALHKNLQPLHLPWPDISDAWLRVDLNAKREKFQSLIEIIENRAPDSFDAQSRRALRRRIELLPRLGALLEALPPLSRQILHGDYSIWNILFKRTALVAVVDFQAHERFLTSFEIGRAALNPETLERHGWRDVAVPFIEAYCDANPAAAKVDIQFAPHVWAIQLIRSEYGVREHYVAPIEFQQDLDRFWFQRCSALELVLADLDEIAEAFVRSWECRALG